MLILIAALAWLGARPPVVAADSIHDVAAAADTIHGAAQPADSSAGAPSPAGAGAAMSPAAAADSLPLRLVRRGFVVSGGGERQGLAEPAGVAVDAFARIVVSDARWHRIQRYDAHGVWIEGAGTLGSDSGQLQRPGAVATLGNFGVAVLDRENRRVVSYDLHGRLLGTLIDLADPVLTDQVGRIDGVTLAADRGGAVYVVDADRDRLLAFDFGGRYLRAIGGFGTRPGSFQGLAGLAVTPRGELVTAERGTARVQRLDAGGRVTGVWKLPVGRGRGALPVAVDDSSRVVVADETSGRLWVYDGGGRLLAVASGCESPVALAFAPDGTLLVAEAGAGRVSRWSLAPGAPATRGE